MTVAVVIPALNEAATIASVVARAKAFGTVIVVDDGSSDHTAACAAAVGATVVSHQRNAGYDGALQSGFVAASSIGAEIVVTLDADGQHDPDMLLQALKPIRDGRVDLVIGQRDVLPRVAERLFSWYSRARWGVRDPLCGLKVYSMELFRRHGRFDGTRSVGTELMIASLASGARWQPIEVAIRPRADQPRFGGLLRANMRVLRALIIAVVAGITGSDCMRRAP